LDSAKELFGITASTRAFSSRPLPSSALGERRHRRLAGADCHLRGLLLREITFARQSKHERRVASEALEATKNVHIDPIFPTQEEARISRAFLRRLGAFGRQVRQSQIT